MADNDEYELIPLTHLRRLEKRLEGIEGNGRGGSSDSMFLLTEMIEIVKATERMAQDVAKSNRELRDEIAKMNGMKQGMDGMTAKGSELLGSVEKLITFLREEGSDEMPEMPPGMQMPPDYMIPIPQAPGQDAKNKAYNEKMDKLIELNTKTVEAMSEMSKRLGRFYPMKVKMRKKE